MQNFDYSLFIIETSVKFNLNIATQACALSSLLVGVAKSALMEKNNNESTPSRMLFIKIADN